MPLSSEDKLRLRLSKQRVERWEVERRKPVATNAQGEQTKRCKGIVWGETDTTPETIKRDVHASLERLTDGAAYRVNELDHVRRGDNFADYAGAPVMQAPLLGNGKAIYRPREKGLHAAAPRATSPFKRKSVAPLIVVKKAKTK